MQNVELFVLFFFMALYLVFGYIVMLESIIPNMKEAKASNDFIMMVCIPIYLLWLIYYIVCSFAYYIYREGRKI